MELLFIAFCHLIQNMLILWMRQRARKQGLLLDIEQSKEALYTKSFVTEPTLSMFHLEVRVDLVFFIGGASL